MPPTLHVAVTGASSGIGEALVREFSAAGAAVTLVARRADNLRAIAGSLSGPTCVLPRDLSDPATASEWLPEAAAALGPVDVLINNAGVQVIGPTAHVDVERGEMSLRLNLLTPLRLIHAVLPDMLERGQGSIINISSMAALAPTPAMTWYNAGKAGLAGASEALRGELRATPVHVCTVYPGIIGSTEMGRKGLDSYQSSRLLALQPRGTTEELARRIRRATDRRSARVIYPTSNALARWFPTITRSLMDRFTPPLVLGSP